MPVNNNYIVVFDFETGGLNTSTLEPVQIAAVALDPRTFEEVDFFQSLMRPLDMNNLQAEAMKVNGLKKEQLTVAPEQGVVWEQFCKWVKKFNRKGKGRSSLLPLPIPAGKNIRKFDLPIAHRLCKTYGMVSDKGNPNIFNDRITIDLEDFLFHWFENSDELISYSMDEGVRPFFGLDTQPTHDALVDTRQTALLIVKYLKLYRDLLTRKDKNGDRLIKFAGSCKGK